MCVNYNKYAQIMRIAKQSVSCINNHNRISGHVLSYKSQYKVGTYMVNAIDLLLLFDYS